MPDTLHFYDMAVRFASSSAIGIGVVLLLLITLRILLPPGDRHRLRVPAIFLALYILIVPLRLFLTAENALSRALYALSLFLMLTALGRSAFLLLVDVILGIRFSRPMSRITREICQGLVYAVVVLITLRAAGVEPGSLLTTSALLTAVIGLSLQDTLGNLFAGLSIQAQSPFEVGDWIQIEPDPRFIGQVIEINWRATKILTLEQIELIIPNAALAKSSIRNFTKPSLLARRTIEVPGPYDVSPRKVEDALVAAARSTPGVLPEPAPYVHLSKFADSSITYLLCFFIHDFARRDRIDTAVRQRIWFTFQRSNIVIPFPTQTLQLHDNSLDARTRHDAEKQARRRRSLSGVDFLTTLPAPLLDRLAALSKTDSYTFGEVIIRQGDAGDELFIVQSGEVSVLLGRAGGSTVEVARLGPGKFFGEMSLMTGERRSATVQAAMDCELVKVDKESFHDILAAAPDLAERITEVLVTRQTEIDENVSARAARHRSEVERKTNDMLGKIKQFFAI
jgi:small-conductance mechanosensitive channel/CRP-like cAMP-binding protein